MQANKIQILIFSLGASRYGIDVEQIAYITNFAPAEYTASFAELMNVEPLIEYNYSKMLIVKGENTIPIFISEPDEVREVSVVDIRKLPNIMLVTAKTKGVWGLLPDERGIIILIDFYKNEQFERLFCSNEIL